ncbi:MAG: fluoride efflux transporter CrcB [Clostridiaceae bacterium]|nr:fluoride efflux transporter CrcB [Clostridiaceae bacterium]
MQKIFYVGIGGFVGASLRYIISIQSTKWFGSSFPFGTLIVNVLGGFLMGAIMQISTDTTLISPNQRLILTTGVLGGLTTFSTFSLETINLFSDSRYVLGTLNISLNLFFSLFGLIVGKLLIQRII